MVMAKGTMMVEIFKTKQAPTRIKDGVRGWFSIIW
jgi:hypothetical protein